MRQLFLCNSVYQVMVALWMKHRYYKENVSDIIISNHMNGGKEIAHRLEETELYEKVFYVESLDESRYRVKRNKLERISMNLDANLALKKYVTLCDKYTDLYLANFDGFSQMMFTALSRKNNNLKLHVFEDGLSTYCEIEKYYKYFEHHYYEPSDDKNICKYILHKYIYRLRPLYGNVSDLYVFNPEQMKWDPKCPVYGLEKIEQSDKKFKALVNQVFAVDKSEDKYDCKYIFFEESFFADGESINDVELVEQLAERVGKENIMIKIHPRNPVNRFAELGYKTNKDTSIPWEVILMTMDDVENKVFLTVASSTILNPIMIFGTKIKAFSLYPCLTIVPKRLQGESWEFLKELFLQYPEMITICDNINIID